MKTHIPASLRKALIAALFATASLASTSYAKAVDFALDVVNWSDGYAETTLGIDKYSTGYTDLTFSGTDPSLGTVDHWCHDYNVLSLPDHFTDRSGDDTEIWVEPDYYTGKYIVHSITAAQGKDSDTNFNLDGWHDHASQDEYGYSYSWSNGNIWVDEEAVLEVTTTIDAHNIIGIGDASRVTVGGKVSAGEIRITTGASLTAENINVTRNNLWDPDDDDYDSTGMLLITHYGTNVTVTGTVRAEGGVKIDDATLYASTINSTVSGEYGYVRALEGQNLYVEGVASKNSQYIVDNGCSITIDSIGYYDEDAKKTLGNGNKFGYGADSSNIKADNIYVRGDIISDNNSLGALGSAVYDHVVAPFSNAIRVNGSITGNGNELFVRSQDAAGIWVGKDVSGNNNDLTINDGDIHIGGVLGRTKDGDNGAKGNSLSAGDNITIHQLSDNEDLNIEALNGEVVVEAASEGTLLNAHITAEDDVVFSENEVSEKQLNLVGSEVVSETGDIRSNQILKANATVLKAEEGDINVYSLIDDSSNAEYGGIQVTTNNLISKRTLTLNGYSQNFDKSFVNVAGDMRTIDATMSFFNFTDWESVKVGGNVDSGSQLNINSVNGMRVGTLVEEEGEDGQPVYTVSGGNMTAEGNINIIGSIVEVLDSMESEDGDITVSQSGVTVGTQVVADYLSVENGSIMKVNRASELPEGETSVLDVAGLTVKEGSQLRTGDVQVAGSTEITGTDTYLGVLGDLELTAAEDSDTISINDNATVYATDDVTIQGLEFAMAEVDHASVEADGNITLTDANIRNEASVVAKGDITLTNAGIYHVNDIQSEEGDIVLYGEDFILHSRLGGVGEDHAIVVDREAEVYLYEGTEEVFDAALAGTGSVYAIDDNLRIYHDSQDFNGYIWLGMEDGVQSLAIASNGVGEHARIDLDYGNCLYTTEGGQGAQLGNVYTWEDGSFIWLDAVEQGNTATATSLNLTEGTTYAVYATTDEETGAMVSDCITVTNGYNANGARVYASVAPMVSELKDGSRYTIVAGEAMEGEDVIAPNFNEDVLYDMDGTQRELQARNMHLEHNAKGVDLVVSENYKALDSKNANVNAVREIIMPMDAMADHTPGVLAQSTSNLDHILDALDYTRSGGDAKKGLLSVSAAANLIVPNMMMDSTRHHLSTLRDHINAPVCSKTVNSKGNVWAAYSGGHDYIGGDDNMDKYSHNYNGAIIGGDYAVNCNWAIGLSAGYEGSIARTTGTRADVNTTFIDAYAVGRTGNFIHKFSVGVGIHRSDMTRATNIAAKGHDYHGVSTGKVKSTSVNFGYDVARLYAIDEVSSISPFFAVDLGIQNLKDLNEKGQEDASVVTKYKNFTQLDAALGVSYAHTFQAFAQQAGVFSVSLAMHSEFSAHRATADNHFVDTPEDTWKTRSAKRAPFYGELGGNVLVPFTEHFSGTAGMSFEFSADRTYIGGHAGVNYRF